MRLPASLFILLLSLPALAQEPAGLVPLPEIPPPPGMVDADLEPQITISQKGTDKVEEFRIRGHLYLIRVTPAHGKSYYLLDPKGDGLFIRHDDLSPNFQVPMWVIAEF